MRLSRTTEIQPTTDKVQRVALRGVSGEKLDDGTTLTSKTYPLTSKMWELLLRGVRGEKLGVRRRNLWELLLRAKINERLEGGATTPLTSNPYPLTSKMGVRRQLPLRVKINERLEGGATTPLTSNPYSLTSKMWELPLRATKTDLFWNKLFQKVVSGLTILAFNVVFILPITLLTDLNAQSVPVLGSTKQFASDELKPYVDAAKLSATDSATYMNAVTGGEQVLQATWEASVNAEIEAIVGGVTNSDTVNNVNVYKDAVRAQLELQKQQTKNQWLADANAYIQAELQIFLATLSQNTSNNVTTTNTNAVQTINPTVQSVTTTPASQATNPAQAAESYYQGSQLWDSKWQDLVTKQNTWEQNSLNAIQTGILQWNQSITGLENDKLSYLNGIEQTKTQWLANKQLIQNAQTQMRSALQTTITNIKNQENQLKNSASSDPSLTAVFGDMDELIDDLQDALNSNASLGTLAQTLGDFFQNQIGNATAKADYWNLTKWQETYATQTLEFKKEVATATLSCSNTYGGGSWCNGLPTGSHAVTYNADGNVYGWAATSGGFQSVVVSNLDPITTVNPYYAELNQQYQSCQAQASGGSPMAAWTWMMYPCSSFGNNGENAPVQSTTVDPNASTGYHSEGHYTATCSGIDAGGTCTGGTGGYTLGLQACSGWAYCGYNKTWVTDNSYTTSVTETFNQSQKNQIAQNTNIRNAVLGNYNIAFGQAAQAGNAVAGSSVALETKVWLGGTALTSSNWYTSMGLIDQVQVQTKYKYIDTAMQANQNFWTSMKTQFTNIASTFLSLVNPLKDWEARSEAYEDEYQTKLLELEQTKQSTITNYDNQIAQMKAARGAWVTQVYGYQIAGIEGSADNADSQYRNGEENWDNTISTFQQAELNWYLSAKDTLQQAVTAPDGETQYQTNAITQANQLETQITNSETNTLQLFNAATGLYQTYQYSAAGNLMNQALTNLQNQTNWNGQGATLSQTIADSFGRTQTYQTAELNASNRINALAQTIYGNGAYVVDNTELQSLQTQANTSGQNQTYWQSEINGTNGGFNFNGRRTTSISTTTEYTNIRNDISVATTLQAEVVDEERGYLKVANEYFEKSERYQELANKAESEAKFDEAALYTGYAVREKNNAVGYLKKKYFNLGEEITTEVDTRGLTYTRDSFLGYKESLIHKNFQNSAQVQKQIQDGKNAVQGILAEGESYNQIQGMLQTATNLNRQGAENKERIEKLLLESKELSNRNIGEGLLDGLQDMIASIQSSLPQEVSNNGVSQYIQAQEKELAEKQEKAKELLTHMNSLVTNNNDLSALQTLLQGSGQAMNLAANSAVSKYLDDYAKKLQKDNEERSNQLQKTLLEALTNGDNYKYLRDAGYGFRADGDGISAYRQIYSGEIAIDGSAMKSTSYSPDLEYQYIRMETKFSPGNLSVNMLDPNSTTFSAEMVAGVKGYIDNVQKNMETMFAQFSDKTQEVKQEYAQNQEIESYQKKLYESSKESFLTEFRDLEGNFKEMFNPAMNGLKDYHEQGSKYNFSTGSLKGQSGEMKKIGKAMYDGAEINDTVFAGSRELKGSVNVKGVPVEVSYGMQYLIVASNFDVSNLHYNFKLKGIGTSYVGNELSNVNRKYTQYEEDIQSRIDKQAKANDAEKESKGFLFTILNGMNGGSGSMGQRFTQAVRSEAQSRITGAVAEATGLPASLVGALVGGSSMKDAVKAYVKDETTNAISKATGIPAWMISNQMEKMNKPKEQWYQSQEFQMVTTVAAVVAAPLTGGASLMVAMAVNAGLGAATGAAGGGLKGALAGAAGGVISTYTRSVGVNVGLSYSAENGFGASVGVGIGPAAVSVGISERGGTTVDVGFSKGKFNAGLSYNSKTGKANINAGLEVAEGMNLGISYNEGDGFGASFTKSFSNGVTAGVSWSERGGLGGNIGYEAPGDKSQPKDSLANKMKGAGGSLNFSQRDGISASLNASGGVNAGNWSQAGGFQANTNFLNDKWKADYLAEQGAKEQAEAESKAKQNRNNQEQGADAISGIGRRLDEDGFELHHTSDGENESGDNIGGDNGKGKKPTLDQIEAMMNRYNSYQEGFDSIRNTKTTHYSTTHQEGSNVVRSVRTESGENGKTKITIDRMGNVGFDAETTPFYSRDSKGNLVPVTGANVSSPFTGYRTLTGGAHDGIDVISHAFRASANLEVTNITHGASRNVGGDPTKQAGIWVHTDKNGNNKLMTYSTVDESGKAFRDKSGKPDPQAIEYTAALAAQNNISAQDHSKLLNHAMNNPSQYHGNGNSVTGRYTMSDGTKVDLIYKHAPNLEGLQNGKPVLWQKGDTIHQGSMILNVGSTGRSTGPHAHFEVQSKSTLGLDLDKNADVIRPYGGKGSGVYVIDGRYFTNNILKKDLENQ